MFFLLPKSEQRGIYSNGGYCHQSPAFPHHGGRAFDRHEARIDRASDRSRHGLSLSPARAVVAGHAGPGVSPLAKGDFRLRLLLAHAPLPARQAYSPRQPSVLGGEVAAKPSARSFHPARIAPPRLGSVARVGMPDTRLASVEANPRRIPQVVA